MMTNNKHTFDPTKPVQTRDGRPVRIICSDYVNSMGDKQIIYLIRHHGDCGGEYDCAYFADSNGRSHIGSPHQDLINVPVKHTGWMNIYPTNEYFDAANFVMPNSGIYKTRDEADLRNGHPNRIACIQIEFTEGEGL